MGYVQIIIKDVASRENLQRREDRMLEKAKCWNKFCFGIYGENELRAVHVTKDGELDTMYLTTLCEDCIKDIAAHDVLINEKHLMIESSDKLK
jgi:hypothetical protein